MKNLICTMKNVKYKQKKYKKLKDRVIKISAPVVIVPDPKDRPTPVLTDRYFMEEVWKYLGDNKVKIIDHWLEDGKMALVFETKEEAIIFKLKFPNYTSWRENATTVGVGYQDPDKGPHPSDMLFPGRNC